MSSLEAEEFRVSVCSVSVGWLCWWFVGMQRRKRVSTSISICIYFFSFFSPSSSIHPTNYLLLPSLRSNKVDTILCLSNLDTSAAISSGLLYVFIAPNVVQCIDNGNNYDCHFVETHNESDITDSLATDCFVCIRLAHISILHKICVSAPNEHWTVQRWTEELFSL